MLFRISMKCSLKEPKAPNPEDPRDGHARHPLEDERDSMGRLTDGIIAYLTRKHGGTVHGQAKRDFLYIYIHGMALIYPAHLGNALR
jgi:hypothetical protein